MILIKFTKNINNQIELSTIFFTLSQYLFDLE